MALFEMPSRKGRAEAEKVITKSKTLAKATSTVKKGNNLIAHINEIRSLVESKLGQYKDEYEVITDLERLQKYIDNCIVNQYISIDTETDGLDPLQNTLAGICIYTPDEKGAYIPLNHISYITKQRLSEQLDVDVVMKEFERLLEAGPDIDMFNAKFDMRFLRANGLKNIYCTWDGYLASMILNENEPTHSLKPLHKKYVLKGKGDAFTFDSLFDKVPFTYIPYTTGYLYAAHDPVITYELCNYQRKHLRADSERQDIRDMYWVFKNIEMPCISVVADMEDIGVDFDTAYQQQLSQRYNKLLEEKTQQFYKECDKYKTQIDAYKAKTPDHKLDDPINMGSPTQLAVLFYDVLKLKSPDKKAPRGTGVDILTKLDNPIAKAVLDYRTMSKLVSTYIDKLPECVNPKDGRIHCSFNQYGARTGRFSSSDPNLQNIPSHNKDIRQMFKATNKEEVITSDTDEFVVDSWCSIDTPNGWQSARQLKQGDLILVDSKPCKIVTVRTESEKIIFGV
jgi:DNA polymerase I-like protein with 3'-5' exonuclease and polymerase domains